MAKLNEFIAQVKNIGMARTNRYTVMLTPPNNEWMAEYGDLRDMLLFCDQVQVPGVNLATVQNRTFGEFREVPYEKLYGDIQLNFYVDTGMYVKGFFDAWMNSIQNPVTRNFSYYKSYTTQMTIDIEDLNDETRYSVTAYECYPKTVSPIQLDYASKEVMKLQVTMQYKYWTSYATRVENPDGSDQSLAIGQFLNQDGMVPESYYNDFKGFQQDVAQIRNVGNTLAGYGW